MIRVGSIRASPLLLLVVGFYCDTLKLALRILDPLCSIALSVGDVMTLAIKLRGEFSTLSGARQHELGLTWVQDHILIHDRGRKDARA